ncbi:MAG TPA: hypothetical protein DEA08_07320, partial [Planctomycetes bacterium]|nr:hypothetical protein [Planctomycetota bacterium]
EADALSEEELIEKITGKKPEKWMIAEFPEGFVAEPEWFNGKIVLSHYREASEEIRKARSVGNTKASAPKIRLRGKNATRR